MKERALVLEVKKRTCIVLTEDGNFRETLLIPGIHPGQEILIPVKRRFAYLKPLLVAASLVIMLAAAGMYRNWLSPAVAAYVSLDINPSVELALDKNSIVRGAEGLEPEGDKLLSGVKVEGLPLGTAVDKLLEAAINEKYISEEKDNIILTTVTVKPDQKQTVSKDKLVKAIEAPLQKANIKAQVVVGNVSPEIRDGARQKQMSTGRYLMYLEAGSKGGSVSPEQFRAGSIRSIEKDAKIDLREIMDKNRSKYEKVSKTPDSKNKQVKKESKLNKKEDSVVVIPVAPDKGRTARGYEPVRVDQPGQSKESINTVIKYFGPYISGFEKEMREYGVTHQPDGNSYSINVKKVKKNEAKFIPGNDDRRTYPKRAPDERENKPDNKRDIIVIPPPGHDHDRQTPDSNRGNNQEQLKKLIQPANNYLRSGVDILEKGKNNSGVTLRLDGNFSSFNKKDMNNNNNKAKSRSPFRDMAEEH